MQSQICMFTIKLKSILIEVVVGQLAKSLTFLLHYSPAVTWTLPSWQIYCVTRGLGNLNSGYPAIGLESAYVRETAGVEWTGFTGVDAKADAYNPLLTGISAWASKDWSNLDVTYSPATVYTTGGKARYFSGDCTHFLHCLLTIILSVLLLTIYCS